MNEQPAEKKKNSKCVYNYTSSPCLAYRSSSTKIAADRGKNIHSREKILLSSPIEPLKNESQGCGMRESTGNCVRRSRLAKQLRRWRYERRLIETQNEQEIHGPTTNFINLNSL